MTSRGKPEPSPSQRINLPIHTSIKEKNIEIGTIAYQTCGAWRRVIVRLIFKMTRTRVTTQTELSKSAKFVVCFYKKCFCRCSELSFILAKKEGRLTFSGKLVISWSF